MHVGAKLPEVLIFPGQVAGHDQGHGISIEGILSGESVVKYHAESVEVRASVEFELFELFGGHEVNRAKQRVFVRNGLFRRFDGKLSQSKIEEFELHPSARKPSHHEIFRLEITVLQMGRVCGDNSFQGLFCYYKEILLGKGSANDDLLECFSLEEFHHHKGSITVFTKVVDADNVG